MEHFELPHALTPDNSQMSSYLTVPHLPPKTRCNNCCLHHCVPQSTEETQHPSVMSFCNGNFCTQTCFSSYQRYNQLASNLPHCNCHSSHSRMHSYVPPPPPTTPIPPPPSRCPCYNPQQAATQEHNRHFLSHSYLATENLTFPAPQYAMAHYVNAYSRSPSMHHSWEPTTGYQDSEYHVHMHDTAVPDVRIDPESTHEYHSHVHRHISNHVSVICTNRNHLFRDQALYTFASRPHRRHTSRTSSYPYPPTDLVDYRTYQRYHTLPSVSPVLASPYILAPQPHFPPGFNFSQLMTGELEVEPIDGEWEEGPSVEPVGLNKEQINKLPCYVVTKKTMEEFTENERCVVCMCEFDIDDKLRILPCAHEFHTECVDKWLQTNRTCPICRATVEIT